MSRSENAFTMKPPEGMASSSPSSSSRTSAIRTGVRDTPVVSTACSSEMRSPGLKVPERIWSRNESCARTVCETERSASRSAMTYSAACNCAGVSFAIMRSITRRAHIAPWSMLRL